MVTVSLFWKRSVYSKKTGGLTRCQRSLGEKKTCVLNIIIGYEISKYVMLDPARAFDHAVII